MRKILLALLLLIGCLGQVRADCAQYSILQYDPADTLTCSKTIAGVPFSTIREVLSAARTYYVRTDGNDACAGTTDAAGSSGACAFKTWQKAADTITDTLDCGGKSVTVQQGSEALPKTYTAGFIPTRPFVNCVPQVTGNATPSNVVINTTSANCFQAVADVRFSVSGFKCTTTTSGDAFQATQGGVISINGAVNCGATVTACLHAIYGGKIFLTAALTLSGNSIFAFWAEIGASVISIINQTVTLTGTPVYTVFAQDVDGAMMFLQGTTYSGSATGTRFNILTNSVIETAGAGGTCATPSGLFPGTGGGCATGGIIN